MGSCGISRKQTNSVIVNNSSVKSNVNNSGNNNENNRNNNSNPNNVNIANTNNNANNKNTQNQTSKDTKEFKDLEEYEEDYSGEGIKRIKAYKWVEPFDKLYKLRMEFWASKKENKKVWSTIKQACESDHLTAQGLLMSVGIMPIDGSMKVLIDNSDNIYQVPNFCINDPLHKKEIHQKDNVPVEVIKIGIVDMFNPSKVSYIKIPNNVNCIELKKCYAEAKKLDFHKHKIRAIYQGVEILDDQTLGQHNIKTNYKIQFAIRQLSESELNKSSHLSSRNESDDDNERNASNNNTRDARDNNKITASNKISRTNTNHNQTKNAQKDTSKIISSSNINNNIYNASDNNLNSNNNSKNNKVDKADKADKADKEDINSSIKDLQNNINSSSNELSINKNNSKSKIKNNIRNINDNDTNNDHSLKSTAIQVNKKKEEYHNNYENLSHKSYNDENDDNFDKDRLMLKKETTHTKQNSIKNSMIKERDTTTGVNKSTFNKETDKNILGNCNLNNDTCKDKPDHINDLQTNYKNKDNIEEDSKFIGNSKFNGDEEIIVDNYNIPAIKEPLSKIKELKKNLKANLNNNGSNSNNNSVNNINSSKVKEIKSDKEIPKEKTNSNNINNNVNVNDDKEEDIIEKINKKDSDIYYIRTDNYNKDKNDVEKTYDDQVISKSEIMNLNSNIMKENIDDSRKDDSEIINVNKSSKYIDTELKEKFEPETNGNATVKDNLNNYIINDTNVKEQDKKEKKDINNKEEVMNPSINIKREETDEFKIVDIDDF